MMLFAEFVGIRSFFFPDYSVSNNFLMAFLRIPWETIAEKSSLNKVDRRTVCKFTKLQFQTLKSSTKQIPYVLKQQSQESLHFDIFCISYSSFSH